MAGVAGDATRGEGRQKPWKAASWMRGALFGGARWTGYKAAPGVRTGQGPCWVWETWQGAMEEERGECHTAPLKHTELLWFKRQSGVGPDPAFDGRHTHPQGSPWETRQGESHPIAWRDLPAPLQLRMWALTNETQEKQKGGWAKTPVLGAWHAFA